MYISLFMFSILSVSCPRMPYNGWRYKIVGDCGLLSYLVTLTFFTSHIHSKPSKTRMHYTMC